MVEGFLFWLFLVGILIASFQDLKRREVDNWLNLLLLISGFGFIFFKAVFEGSFSLVFFAVVSLIAMFLLANLFYYSRVFAGGDAKLLLAMCVLFVGASFGATMINIGTFVVLLMLCGSVYGLFYSGVLVFLNIKKIKKAAPACTEDGGCRDTCRWDCP